MRSRSRTGWAGLGAITLVVLAAAPARADMEWVTPSDSVLSTAFNERVQQPESVFACVGDATAYRAVVSRSPSVDASGRLLGMDLDLSAFPNTVRKTSASSCADGTIPDAARSIINPNTGQPGPYGGGYFYEQIETTGADGVTVRSEVRRFFEQLTSFRLPVFAGRVEPRNPALPVVVPTSPTVLSILPQTNGITGQNQWSCMEVAQRCASRHVIVKAVTMPYDARREVFDTTPDGAASVAATSASSPEAACPARRTRPRWTAPRSRTRPLPRTRTTRWRFRSRRQRARACTSAATWMRARRALQCLGTAHSEARCSSRHHTRQRGSPRRELAPRALASTSSSEPSR